MSQLPIFEQPLPEGMLINYDYLSLDEEKEIVADLDSRPWETSMKRRVQQYGASYNYISHEVKRTTMEMPLWMRVTAEHLYDGWLTEEIADSCIVNEYLTGQGISWHTDAKALGPEVVCISLLDSWVMDLRKGSERSSIMLDRGSAMTMTGPSRYEWQHQITARSSDRVGGVIRQRGPRRISLTFRKIT